MYTIGPTVSEFLLHRAASKLPPRLIKESAKLVQPRHPDHHGSGVRDSSKSLFAFAQRRFGVFPLGDVVNRSNQVATSPFVVEDGRDRDFAGQPAGRVITGLFP